MRILVVEDDAALAEVVAEGLRDQGMAVDLARDGLAAAAKLDLAAHDVVVLDRDLPGLHGDTICRMITERVDRPMVLMLTGIELDPLRRTVVRDGRRLDLSVKEFALLEALLRESPGFLSAEALLDQVWDENADPFTNTVAVTMGRLRRKLGGPPAITTTPGVGYRFAERGSAVSP
jgi:DNA-binding response OmpR family regulator